VARYNYLPPGKYEFQVTAKYEGGFWSEFWTRLPIEVLPQFWQTGWFQTAAVGGLLLGRSLPPDLS